MRAESTMTRDVIVAPPELPLREAQRIMTVRQIRHLPVVQRGRVVGILSDRDILRRLPPHEGGQLPADTTVADAMSPSPISCRPSTTISWLAETMVTIKIDAVPVVDPDGRLLGLVTSSDLLSLLIGPEEEDRLLPFRFNLRYVDASGEIAVA